jgi:hypothetical protein
LLSQLFLTLSHQRFLNAMTSKKSADQLFQDLLGGTLVPPSDANNQQSVAEFAQVIDDSYDVNADDVKAALYKYQDQINDSIGVKLTDDQLAALAGGKNTAGIAAGIGAGAAAGGVGAGLAAVGAVYVGLFIVIK